MYVEKDEEEFQSTSHFSLVILFQNPTNAEHLSGLRDKVQS